MRAVEVFALIGMLFLAFFIYINYYNGQYVREPDVLLPVSFSDVCNNENYYFNIEQNSSSIVQNGTTYVTYYNFQFVDGIVVYSYWNNSIGSGLLAVTGRYQIENNQTENVLVIYTKTQDTINNIPAGSIITVEHDGIHYTNWHDVSVNGTSFRFLDQIDQYIFKTGVVPAQDPDYQDILNAVAQYEQLQQTTQQSAMFLNNWLLIWIILFSPMSPMSPSYSSSYASEDSGFDSSSGFGGDTGGSDSGGGGDGGD